MLRKEDASLLSGRGRYADDLPVAVGTLCTPTSSARRMRMPKSCASMRRARWRMTASGRCITGEEVRKLSDPFLARGQDAGAAMGAGGRARALCRRAGGAGGGREPLYRRGRRRTGRDRLRAARSGDRSGRRLPKRRAAPASRSQDQRSLGARFHLWRSASRLRPRRPPHRHDGAVSPALVHADRMLRRRRAHNRGRKQLRRHWRISRGRSRCIR